MANDSRPIGEKLRAMEERAKESEHMSEKRPEKPSEGSRESVKGGGAGNRPPREEQKNQERVPPRGENKGGSHA